MSQQRCLDWLAAVPAPIATPSVPSGDPPSPHDSANDSLYDSALRLPAKRKRFNTGMTSSHTPADYRDMGDLDSTPRVKRPRHSQKRSCDDDRSDMASDSGLSRKSLHSEQSAGTDRSIQSSQRSGRSSPVKTINRLHTLEQPILDATLQDHMLADMPPDMVELIQGFRRCKRLRCMVPASLKTALRQRYPLQEIWSEDDIWWNDSASPNVAPGQAPLHDYAPSLAEIEGIVDEANDLDMFSDVEAAWNTNCHGPLLMLARRLSRQRGQIRASNVTTAQCLHRFRPYGMTGKSVDFAIALRIHETDPLFRAYCNLRPEDDGSVQFNHTSAQHIARNPLAVSIETKRPETGGQEFKLQLRMWAFAQLRWLEEVRRCPPTKCDIYLPYMVAIGSEWYSVLVKGEFNADGILDRVLIFNNKERLGSAMSVDGVFSILGALKYVINWTVDIWQPFLERWLNVAHTRPSPLASVPRDDQAESFTVDIVPAGMASE